MTRAPAGARCPPRAADLEPSPPAPRRPREPHRTPPSCTGPGPSWGGRADRRVDDSHRKSATAGRDVAVDATGAVAAATGRIAGGSPFADRIPPSPVPAAAPCGDRPDGHRAARRARAARLRGRAELGLRRFRGPGAAPGRGRRPAFRRGRRRRRGGALLRHGLVRRGQLARHRRVGRRRAPALHPVRAGRRPRERPDHLPARCPGRRRLHAPGRRPLVRRRRDPDRAARWPPRRPRAPGPRPAARRPIRRFTGRRPPPPPRSTSRTSTAGGSRRSRRRRWFPGRRRDRAPAVAPSRPRPRSRGPGSAARSSASCRTGSWSTRRLRLDCGEISTIAYFGVGADGSGNLQKRNADGSTDGRLERLDQLAHHEHHQRRPPQPHPGRPHDPELRLEHVRAGPPEEPPRQPGTGRTSRARSRPRCAIAAPTA